VEKKKKNGEEKKRKKIHFLQALGEFSLAKK